MPRRSSKVHLLSTAVVLAVATAGCAFLPSYKIAQAATPTTAIGKNMQGSHLAKQLDPSFLPLLLVSTPADAADDIPGALVAYGHYLSIVISTICLTVERLTIKPGMTQEEESRMAIADAVYVASGLLVLVTGYLRASQYGKGWSFYQNEPIFWLKVILVAIAGACSFFVTGMLIKRAIARKDAEDNGKAPLAPISEKLAARMTSIVNAELLAIASIPLTATLMARGVLYADAFPWQAGAGAAVLALVGLGFRYVKEALDWKDDDDMEAVAA